MHKARHRSDGIGAIMAFMIVCFAAVAIAMALIG